MKRKRIRTYKRPDWDALFSEEERKYIQAWILEHIYRLERENNKLKQLELEPIL